MRTQHRIGDLRCKVLGVSSLIGILSIIGCGSTYSGGATTNSSSAPANYTVGGTVSGLAGSGLVLQDNNANNLPINANGPFTFTVSVASGTNYTVTVFSQPTNVSQTCVVTSGGGTANANVSTVSVTCTTDTFSVGGTVTGLIGSGMVLQDNGGNNLPASANGVFAFTTPLASGTGFTVAVLNQPANPVQTCAVNNASGTVTTGPISNVTVACPNLAVVPDTSNSRVLLYNLPLTTGQSANIVLGQTNFTSATSGTTASTMAFPSGVAADKAGNIYVTDNYNCRVTQFRPPFSNGMSASLVFGQSTLNTATCPPNSISATSLGAGPRDLGLLGPTTRVGRDQVFGASLDSNGDLWVSDDGANRIVEYVPPSFSNINGAPAASLALGQQDLNSGQPNEGGDSTPTASSLLDPGVAIFDRSGNLWVADYGNNRVLEYVPQPQPQPPFSTGMAASLVLGQADFSSNSANEGNAAAVAANTMWNPNAVALDSSGNLWVADTRNSRVLEFEPQFTKNMSAILVLGQPDFTHNFQNQCLGSCSPTAATLALPFQVAFDVSGNLYVSDSGNNRTLVFTPPFSNGMNASAVIGQPNFTSFSLTTTATGQSFPVGIITAPPLY